MKWFFDLADAYLKESDWKTLAALKFCLFSLGMIIGSLLPSGVKRGAILICAIVFLVTYIPLVAKLFRIARKK